MASGLKASHTRLTAASDAHSMIPGQQRTLTLVTPTSKVVLQEAIKADSDFLMRSNIMDYS